VNDTLYASGQIASDHKTPLIQVAHQDPAFPYYGSEIQKQTRYVLNNLQKLYHEGGFDLADTVKAQVFLSDLNDFYYFDQIWKEYFPSPPPRTTLEVGKFLVPGCKVQVDLTAAKP
jgi:enamine deaminase RidA (YjgF/YER057c/UK114 family)